ncbi:MAG: hypothetical protein ABEI99_09225 [Halobaculum sp.]
MYETTQTEYGFEMTFADFIDETEMREWAAAVRERLDSRPAESDWHCLVDMRRMKAMSPDGKELMSEIKSECHDAGLNRVGTVVADTTTRLQFQQMSRGTGAEAERYVAADQFEDPVAVAEDWVSDGTEPPEENP